jgi:ACS family hexuronate transporter-like MFS transporter
VVTPIALRWGWRSAFWLTGLLGVGWLALWAWVSDDARLRPRIGAHRASPSPSLAQRSLWAFMAAYAFGGLPLGFVLYGAPLHLGRALGCDQATLGRVLWIPPLGWEVGYFFWGWVLDRAARAGVRSEHHVRSLFLSLAVLATPLALAARLHTLGGVLALLFLAMFDAAGFVIVSLTETTRRHSEDHGAYLAGLGAGAWSLLMTLSMPLFGYLFDIAAFGTAYALAALSPLVGSLGWFMLRTPSG